MIADLSILLNSFNVPINFTNHMVIFAGSFYIAIHNRRIPQWHITPLWYLGLLNLFAGITILIQWCIGPEHPLSYWNLGLFAETLANCSLAAIVLIMFLHTVGHDLRERKKRRKLEVDGTY